MVRFDGGCESALILRGFADLTLAPAAPSSSPSHISPGPFRNTSKSSGSLTVLALPNTVIFASFPLLLNDNACLPSGGGARFASPSKGTSLPSRRRFALGWTSKNPEVHFFMESGRGGVVVRFRSDPTGFRHGTLPLHKQATRESYVR